MMEFFLDFSNILFEICIKSYLFCLEKATKLFLLILFKKNGLNQGRNIDFFNRFFFVKIENFYFFVRF